VENLSLLVIKNHLPNASNKLIALARTLQNLLEQYGLTKKIFV
jgi:hypothetical protein